MRWGRGYLPKAGYRVELSDEVVETTVPAYGFRGFWEHQMRWARSTRDSRRWGYVGMGVTYAVPWAVMTCVASGFALWSFSLLSVVMLARVAVALSVGWGCCLMGRCCGICGCCRCGIFGAGGVGVELCGG